MGEDFTAIGRGLGPRSMGLGPWALPMGPGPRACGRSFSDRREGDPAVLISSYDKAKEYLDWIPKYSIDEIISSMWNIYKNKEAN